MRDYFIYRTRNILTCFLLMNIFLIYNLGDINKVFLVLFTIWLSILYIYININSIKITELNKRLRAMMKGYELIIDSVISIFVEALLYIYLLIINKAHYNKWLLIINLVVSIIIMLIPFINGLFRIMVTSRQLTLINRVSLIFLWWVPIINVIIIKICCSKVKGEYIYEKSKEELNNVRKESEICHTKYPIVLVHGIFFRDWWIINYWGRIPKALKRNGATIYYGKQQSSNPVCKIAEELKNTLMKIINETGCEKVNIIAHSKGGLDSRYAISCLGMDQYIASLTTVNTPHRGCKFAEYLLKKIPSNVQQFINRKYNSLFKMLGDDSPDFLGGVNDLTYSSCVEFNKKVLDSDKVLYQSVTSKMKNVFSASFPLNLGYLLCKKFDGENDGLVSIDSAKWGNFLGLVIPKSKGISHGDIIDLTRKDLDGFDVCEYFVNIVKDLKNKGL